MRIEGKLIKQSSPKGFERILSALGLTASPRRAQRSPVWDLTLGQDEQVQGQAQYQAQLPENGDTATTAGPSKETRPPQASASAAAQVPGAMDARISGSVSQTRNSRNLGKNVVHALHLDDLAEDLFKLQINHKVTQALLLTIIIIAGIYFLVSFNQINNLMEKNIQSQARLEIAINKIIPPELSEDGNLKAKESEKGVKEVCIDSTRYMVYGITLIPKMSLFGQGTPCSNDPGAPQPGMSMPPPPPGSDSDLNSKVPKL